MNTISSNKPEMIAAEVTVRDSQVWLRLLDGSTHSFPIHYYPRLVNASAEDLAQVRLRVGGRALRWDALDEDIWIYDAVVGRYPVAVAS
jgi:hypothetical protein